MSGLQGDDGRQARFLGEKVDPIAQRVVDCADPWEAYHAAGGVSGALADGLDWMPQGGDIYVAWEELTDLYDAGKAPVAEAHAALRQAASDWLDRPTPPGETFIEGWLSRTHNVIRSLVDRHGDFWRSPG